MDYSDKITAISGRDVIMAYQGHPYYYIQTNKDKRVCTCFFWSRYTLFVLNFFIGATGVTIIGLGAWAHVNWAGLKLLEPLVTVPCWLLIGLGIAMVMMGGFGCVGAIRLNLCCIRTFMALVVVVFAVHVAMGTALFIIMDDIQSRMMSIVKFAIISYHVDNDLDRDKNLDYLQLQFSCCGGSSYSNWEENMYYNCSSMTSSSRCGVPSSCCRGTRDEECGYGIREGSKEYTDMFAYTDGCVITLMGIVRENIIVIAALTFSICFLEICCLVLSCIISKYVEYHRQLES